MPDLRGGLDVIAHGFRRTLDRCHRQFHRALLAGCGSARLLALHDALYAQAYRNRRMMMNRLGAPERFLQTHEALTELVLAR